jgi:hypothetical protein
MAKIIDEEDRATSPYAIPVTIPENRPNAINLVLPGGFNARRRRLRAGWRQAIER